MIILGCDGYLHVIALLHTSMANERDLSKSRMGHEIYMLVLKIVVSYIGVDVKWPMLSCSPRMVPIAGQY